MGWVQNLRFSYIFMEPAKTHGIYTVLTSSASETVVFAAFCNTTLYTTTLIVLLLQKQLYVVSLFAYTIKMIYLPCVHMYIHTYKQTINQYKQIVIIHKSIQTYSYTYTWLQMVRPPQPTHRGGGGNIMCTCSIFVCRHKNNDMSTLLGHVHTYIHTNHKSIQTNSYHT